MCRERQWFRQRKRTTVSHAKIGKMFEEGRGMGGELSWTEDVQGRMGNGKQVLLEGRCLKKEGE